ncbi:hypothetical protein [Streptomyces sp. NRRL F-2580]|uniref:hypothetical protein n=1 Tax=Streptomyces sp. NRRL F-2580 TaxID=1463841 RepID=UPI0007C4428A|nr:hypothetical protein [Streptomyces sp. NRRL F-2580]
MVMWIRTYDESRGLWQYFEGDDEGRVLRQVEVRGDDGTPVTAASLDEVLRFQERADIATVSRYEQRYGRVTEAGLAGWEEAPHAGTLSAEAFEGVWLDASRALGAVAAPPPGTDTGTGTGTDPDPDPGTDV